MALLELQCHIEKAFENAENEISKATPHLLSMDGMTGKKTRHFYNNLMNKDDTRYLEIGTWKGSSVCSAMCGNKCKVVCIDNWSEFGGPKDEFLTNFNTYKGENDAIFIEEDCYTVDVSRLQKFNIFMYDGNHTKDSHYKALTHYYGCLDDTFIFIVDDWNWKDVRDGTLESIKKLNLTTVYAREIRTTHDDTHSVWGSPEQQSWHNGIYVAILQKDNTALTQSSNPIISIESFMEMADIVVPEYRRPMKQYSNKTKIIFVSMDHLNNYIPTLLSLTYDYILITGSHNDWCMPYFSYPPNETDKKLHDTLLAHPHLIQWCSTNICISHPKLLAIPIGPKMQWSSSAFYGEDMTAMLRIYSKHCLRPNESFKSNKPNLLYLNMGNTTTNPYFREHVNIRPKTLDLLSSKGYQILPDIPFEQYIETLKSYKFAVSPPGNGMNCHRTWESVMVGTIPICLSTPIDSLYDDLPVLIVKDYSEINDDFLNSKYEDMKRKTYNFSKAYTLYWEQLLSRL